MSRTPMQPQASFNAGKYYFKTPGLDNENETENVNNTHPPLVE